MQQNQLSLETSPYLLQHRHNPVNWCAWSPKALNNAKSADRPILLSIGYAACHWCHVMAHESFEDPETAALMNENYINIKVDREERPDIDKVYMQALHSLGEQGGWPLTMFLDSDARPFWGGTYFPPEPRFGRPGFKHVLREIARIWKNERPKVVANSTTIVTALQQSASTPLPGSFTSVQIEQAADAVTQAVDPSLGGLRGTPKFPQSSLFEFIWSRSLHPHHPQRAAAVDTTLAQISQGGIYDHLAGGMARYSVDPNWLVPHFEKMLYDNAQYVALLTRVWLKTHNPLFRSRIEETICFVLNAMTTPEGVFASSYDADSEGHEGKYYVWSKAEIDALLSPEAAALFCRSYDVTDAGNWEGQNILNRSRLPAPLLPQHEELLRSSRATLLARRNTRIPPGFDHKVLADWNGLMISGLAEAALVFGRSDWALAAQHAMTTILDIHWRNNQLLHASTSGQARHPAVADDYANLITAARALHSLTSEPGYLTTAASLADALLTHHWDQAAGTLFFAPTSATELPVRIQSIHDDATPNANAVMIANFTALHHLTGNTKYEACARQIAARFATEALRNPFAAPTCLKNLRYIVDPIQLVTTGDVANDLVVTALASTGLDVILHRIKSAAELPANHPAQTKFPTEAHPALYLCRGQTCAAPARTLADLEDSLALLGLASGIH